MNSFYRRWAPESVHHLPKIFFWLLISLLVGLLTGLLSSLFLILLHEVTELRWHQKWLIYFLPLGGLGISFVYKKYGKSVEAGNKLLIQELQRPQKTIPFRMIPLVLFGTLTRHLFNRKIKSPYGRIFWGGSLVVTLSLLLGPDRYLGLGIPTISESFEAMVPPFDFLSKILFTAINLSSGFKDGEVTPLFFVGATLGNTLSQWLPLPPSLLAGMGFVAVFAGAANTPLTCLVMGIELFGVESGIYIALACVFSYIFSGHKGIYSSQQIEVPKYASKN